MSHPLRPFETFPRQNALIVAAAMYPTAVRGKKQESGGTRGNI